MDWNQYVSGGVAPPKLEFVDWRGEVVEEITLPADAGGVIKESFLRQGQEATTISGRLVSWLRGFRYQAVLPYKYLLLADYKKMARIFTWASARRGRLRFYPHGDCPHICYWVLPSDDFRFAYAQGKLLAYEGELILLGTELLVAIPLSGENYHYLSSSSALEFFGGGEARVEIPHHSSLSPVRALTLDLRIMLSALPDGGECFYLHNKGAEIEELKVDEDGLLAFTPKSGLNLTASQPLQANQLYCLNVVYDDIEMHKAQIFINGVMRGESATDGDLTDNQEPVKLGCDSSNGSVLYGKLDEYRRTHCALYGDGFPPSLASGSLGRLRPLGKTTVLFHFDECSGNDIYDASAYANHGLRAGESKPEWCPDSSLWVSSEDYSPDQLCHYCSQEEKDYTEQDRLAYYNCQQDVVTAR
jgi:hypothetical protein